MDTYALQTSDKTQRLDFDWGSLYWYAGAPSGNSDHMTLGKCVLKPGQTNPKHYHPNCEEILHVLSGEIQHFVDGKGWFRMSAGDTVTIAANVWHHARNIGATEAHLMIAFSSPNRETIGE